MIVLVGDSSTTPPFLAPNPIRSQLKQAGIHPVNDVTCVVTSDACAGNVEFLQPKWMICLGQRALDALCPVRSLSIGRLHGHCWSTKSGTAMATYAWNPRAPELNKAAQADVEMFGLCVRGDVVPAVGATCVRCGRGQADVVVERLPLCRKCKRFARPVVVQGELFEMRVGDPT